MELCIVRQVVLDFIPPFVFISTTCFTGTIVAVFTNLTTSVVVIIVATALVIAAAVAIACCSLFP